MINYKCIKEDYLKIVLEFDPSDFYGFSLPVCDIIKRLKNKDCKAFQSREAFFQNGVRK